MSNNSITIQPGLVEFLDLEKLATHIATIKGSMCTVQQMFIVSSPDPAVLTALGGLFQPVPEKAATREKKIRGRSKVVRKSWKKEAKNASSEPKPEPTRGQHVRSIEIVGTTDKISRFDLDKQLSERLVEVGAQYRSPKHGLMTVALRGDDLVLVNEAREVV